MSLIRRGRAGCLFMMLASVARADFSSIIWDNDLFMPGNADSYYSNGIVYHHVSDPVPDDGGQRWGLCPGASWIPYVFDSGRIRAEPAAELRHSWELGQIIQTPHKKRRNPPDPEDQPYAGLLYAGCNHHLHTRVRAESMGWQLGVVGPWSGAEDTQRLAHRWQGKKFPAGWGSQLRNELVVNFRYDRQDVLGRIDFGSSGLILHDNKDLALGTLLTSAAYGVNALYSSNPEAAFGLNPNFLGRYPILSRAHPIGFYALSGVQVAGVARNIFLDGNTWREGPSVDRKPVVGSGQLLMGYGFSCLALQVGMSVSTRTFDTQATKWPHYGTLTLAWGCSR